MSVLRERGEAKVGDLEVAVGVEEEVLRLEIAVRDAVAVAELERGDELREVAPRELLRQTAAARELVEELAAAGVVDDEVDLCFRGQNLVDFEDVRVVVEAAHGVDLADYARFHAGIHRLCFVDYFHGDGGVVDERLRFVHLGEASTTEEARELVLAENDSVAWRRW